MLPPGSFVAPTVEASGGISEFEQIAGGLKQVSVASDGTVWGVTTADQVYQRTGITDAAPSGTGWQQVTGSLSQISVGSASKIWGVQSTGNIFHGIPLAPSSNADLSALALSAGTLDPAFDDDAIAYTASVGNATTSITITPTVEQAAATVQVRVNGGVYATVPSGVASGALALNVGSNTINVLVTAENTTTTKTYTVTVTRAAPIMFVVNSTADTVDADPGDGVCADSSGDCTLRAAVEDANAIGGYAIINVPAGTYPLDFALTITAPGISIAGPGIAAGTPRAEVSSACGSVVEVLANGITVQGLAITHGDCGIGVQVGSAATPVSGVAVSGNALTASSGGGTGIRVNAGSDNNSITGNTVTGVSTGISLEDASSNTVLNNTVINSGSHGIRQTSGAGPLVQGNKVLGGGSSTGGSGNAPGPGGIEITDTASGVTIKDNAVIGTGGLGIKVGGGGCDPTTGTVVTGNYVANNGTGGIWTRSTSSGAVIHRNTIAGNGGPNARDEGSGTVWHLEVGGQDRGNFYSDYAGADGNADGVGDTAYVIGGTSDPLPLMTGTPLATPLLFLNPIAGLVGTSVTATGHGFSGAASASVFFGGTAAGSGTPNASGSLTVTFTVPADAAAGATTVTMSNASGSATATFTVIVPIVFTVNSTDDIGAGDPGDGVCAATGGDCTLRAAIEQANALGGGVSINLPAGNYLLADDAQQLSITAPNIAIVGPGVGTGVARAVVGSDTRGGDCGCGDSRIFSIEASDVRIEGLELRLTQADPFPPVIRIGSSSDATAVARVHLTDNASFGGYRFVSVNASSSDNTIEGNVITNTYSYAIALPGASGNTVQGNMITGGGGGILLRRSGNLEDGPSPDNNQVVTNRITGVEGSGIWVHAGSGNSVFTNVITRSAWGVDGDGSVPAGIRFDADSSSNTVSFNALLGNLHHAQDDGTDNNWTVPFLLGVVGNYWSGYERLTGSALADGDSDGCGDVAVTIPGSASSSDACPIVIGQDTLTVDSAADAVDATPGDGICNPCTLRAAVMEANAAPGPAVITVPAGTYTLGLTGRDENGAATGDLDIADDVTLQGAGAATTIIQACSGAGCTGIDRLLHGVGILTMTVSGITLRNGNVGDEGGAIYTEHSLLTVQDSVLTRNAVAAGGGGGIWATTGDTRITGSVIDDNDASGVGGGIYVGNSTSLVLTSTLAVTGSTIRNNTAGTRGGGIATGTVSSDTVKITASTISGNSAGNGGGGIANTGSGTVVAVNVTIQGNSAVETGGGIYHAGAAFLVGNVIVAGSASGGNCSGLIGGDGPNLSSDATCGFTNTGDFENTNPLLGPLANNGGPTLTHTLLPGSPAINGGDWVKCSDSLINSLDQRGTARPQGPVCDIGAVEVVPAGFGAAVSSVGIPTEWEVGGTQLVTVTVTNTGALTWNAGGANPVVLLVQFRATAGSSPITQQTFPLAADVLAGGTATFTNIGITAPLVTADVLELFLVRQGAGPIQSKTVVTVTVAPPGGAIDTASTPAVWVQGKSQTFNVGLTNGSTGTWPVGGASRVSLQARFAGAPGQLFSLPADVNGGGGRQRVAD